jgi:hypothetical protein
MIWYHASAAFKRYGLLYPMFTNNITRNRNDGNPRNSILSINLIVLSLLLLNFWRYVIRRLIVFTYF